MPLPSLQWPAVAVLRHLLQSPAHAAVRVMQVTQANWQLPPSHRRQHRHGFGAGPLIS